MATPSGIFVFEDVTLNGFNYKRTTQTAGEIFPLYSELDKTIAYTLPQMSSYRTMTPTLINKAFPQRSYTRGNYYQEHYSSSPGGTLNRWSTVGQVHGTGDDDTSCVIYWTFTDQDDEYYFNGNEGNSIIGDSSIKFISGFDISHVIFESSITGYTKAQFDAYKSDGSNQTASTINLEDLIANPGDYYIKKFEIHPVCYWDDTNHEWKNGSPVYLTCLVDGGALIQGVSMSGCVLFCDQQTSGSDLGTNCDNYHIWSNTQNYAITDSTQYVRKGGIPVGLNSSNPYSLGTKGEWFFEPTMTTDELDTYIRSQVSASTNNTTNPKQIFTTGHGEAWGYDNYNVSKKGGSYSDVPGAFYYSKYDKVLTYVGYGTKLSEFLASAGCYFHIGSNNANYHNVLNTDSITPDTLHLREDIGLGVMADDGTTTGTWVIGEDIEDYAGINKKGDVVHPDFDPNPPDPDKPDKDDLDNMDTGFASTLSGCTKYFLMSPADVNNLIVDYYTNAFAGSTMSQSIISCYLCGAEPSEFLSTENSKVTIPTVAGQSMFESQRADYQLINAVLNEIPMGSIDVPRMNGDFHDFSPYTIYEVFLPFCGWCSLPDTVAGRTIVARLEVDIRTMAGKGIIMVADDNGNYATVAEMCANIGASAPFAVIEAGLERQAAVTAGIQTAVGVAQGISGAASGHNALAISGFGNAIQGVANGMMSSMANYTQVQGKAGDTSDFANGRQPYLKISWAKTDEVVKTTQFAHAFGYVCDAVGTLGSFSGFTVVSNPHVAINATQAEKEEIKRLLEEGVVL